MSVFSKSANSQHFVQLFITVGPLLLIVIDACRSVCVCVCVCVGTYVCVRVRAYLCVCVVVCLYVGTYRCVFVRFLCLYVCVWVLIVGFVRWHVVICVFSAPLVGQKRGGVTCVCDRVRGWVW